MTVRVSSRGTLEDTYVAGDIHELLSRLNDAAKNNLRFAMFEDDDGSPLFIEITNITRGKSIDPRDEPFMSNV